MDTKRFNNLKDIQKDIILHPEDDLDYIEDLFKTIDITESDISSLRSVFNKLINDNSFTEDQKKFLIFNSWKINFRAKPPTIKEFLTAEWLGPTSENIFPYVENILYQYFDPESKYRNMVMYYPIGVGKSFITILINLLITSHVYLMRNPTKFLNVNESSLLCNVLLSFTKDKAYEILVRPLINMITNSEKFVRCRTEELMVKKMKEYGTSKICYTTAGEGSVLQMGKLSYKHLSSSANLLGLSILVGSATELAFFKEKGFSDEAIMELYNNLRGRIHSRFPDSYYARSILDSSPNSLENEIDKWIMYEAEKDETNLVLKDSKWSLQPWLFPEWEKDKSKIFKVYVGTASKKAKIVEEEELNNYDIRDIIDVPNDAKQLFINDINKSLKDYAGRPSNPEDKLIQNIDIIPPLFTDNLKNIYTFIHAPANLLGEGLIWNKIKDIFFVKINKNIYELSFNPTAERFLSVDQSLKGDVTGIAMSHVVRGINGDLIYITDFTIPIIPTKERINLDAIKYFIHELRKFGKVNLNHVSFDQFQSESSIQYLKRQNFEVERLSVDLNPSIYLSYIKLLNQNRCKMGYNIFMKNNLKSLIMSHTKKGKSKVDHIIGKLVYDDGAKWDISMMGYFAKDVSDAVVASVELAVRYGTINLSYIWDDEKFISNKENMINNIHDRYSLIVK